MDKLKHYLRPASRWARNEYRTYKERRKLRARFGGQLEHLPEDELMLSVYTHYCNHISQGGWPASWSAIRILMQLCQILQPPVIVDLGSGFSSYAFRSFASKESNTLVYSVDDNEEWLNTTIRFLREYDLSTDNVLLWESFISNPPDTANALIFHDLGHIGVRAQTLPDVLRLGSAPSCTVVLDDVHKSSYIPVVKRELAKYSHDFYSLRPYTLDHLSRYLALVENLILL